MWLNERVVFYLFPSGKGLCAYRFHVTGRKATRNGHEIRCWEILQQVALKLDRVNVGHPLPHMLAGAKEPCLWVMWWLAVIAILGGLDKQQASVYVCGGLIRLVYWEGGNSNEGTIIPSSRVLNSVEWRKWGYEKDFSVLSLQCERPHASNSSCHDFATMMEYTT